MTKSTEQESAPDPFPVDLEAEMAAGTIYNPAESDVLYEEGVARPKKSVNMPRKQRSCQRK